VWLFALARRTLCHVVKRKAVAEVDRSTIDKASALQSVALHKSSDPQPTYRPVATLMSRQFLSIFDQRRECFLQALVRDNNVDQALRVLKKKMQREGVFREMKRGRFYEKPGRQHRYWQGV
jgi:ribosomal protein S21